LFAPVDGDRLIDALTDQTLDGGTCDLATLAHPLDESQQWQDPHVVKVLVDRAGFALYFSRAAVPGAFPGGDAAIKDAGARLAWRHVGVYAFHTASLQRYLALPRSPLEVAEGLEQLRALENGMKIRVVFTTERPIGVDTEADLEEVRRRWASEQI
jgi:3-deoxy-manno-octulosonate cytidylyltransferase (CMP-KDO synthetase)